MLKKQPTVSANISYGKKITAEERITLSYLDKWHSFLFHPNVKEDRREDQDEKG